MHFLFHMGKKRKKNESAELLKMSLQILIHAMNGFHTEECQNKRDKREGRKALMSGDYNNLFFA